MADANFAGCLQLERADVTFGNAIAVAILRSGKAALIRGHAVKTASVCRETVHGESVGEGGTAVVS